jgi:hypothetical protein
MRLAPSWPSLSSLLCPALSAAVSEHTSGWAPEEREPLEDMKTWKERRGARPLPTASIRSANTVQHAVAVSSRVPGRNHTHSLAAAIWLYTVVSCIPVGSQMWVLEV